MAVKKQNSDNKTNSIIFDLFKDWQDFASTSFGFFFTVVPVILAVAAFIILYQYNLSLIASITLSSVILGDFAFGLGAGKLYKHGFFASCGLSSDVDYNFNHTLSNP